MTGPVAFDTFLQSGRTSVAVTANEVLSLVVLQVACLFVFDDNNDAIGLSLVV